ncbi:hypothetical protein TDB9533_00084 [Thalassocella blandensis]|nr:hypothetical protein TDB9533_00084 [Thalassocella blandensis]
MHMVKSRWTAFGIHLGISAVIFLCLLGIILFIWYPGVFIEIGGYQGIKIAAGIDLVLGPLLTLIVYKHGKPSLKFDLTIIAVLQITALTAGCWLIYKERPVFQLISYDGLHVITTNELSLFDKYPINVDEFSGDLPKSAYMDLPKNKGEIEQIRFTTEFSDEIPLEARYDLYRDFEQQPSKNLDWLAQQFELDTEHNCRKMQLFSIHNSKQACFDFTQQKIIYLSN